MSNKHLLSLCAALGATLFTVAGCGGSGGDNAAAPAYQFTGSAAADAPAGRGRFAVTIRWPERAEEGAATSRYIPKSANTLYFELTEVATGQKYPFVASRRGSAEGATQTTTFEQFLPVGEYVLACVARPDDFRGGDAGVNLAVGAARLTINDGQVTRVPITLQTTVGSITGALSGLGTLTNPLKVGGFNAQIALDVRSTDGAVIPSDLVISDRRLIRYEVISGADKVRVDDSGGVSGLAVGIAKVRVALRDKPNIFADVPIAVVGDTALSGYSTPVHLVGASPLRLAVAQQGTAPDTGAPAAYTWESLTPNIGTVTADGLLTGIAPGFGTVRVITTGGQLPAGVSLSREYSFLVRRVKTLVIENAPASLDSGQAVTLRALAIITGADGGEERASSPVRWEITEGAAYADIAAETGELRARSASDGAHAVRVRATFVPTGNTAEATITINSYGGVNVGVD